MMIGVMLEVWWAEGLAKKQRNRTKVHKLAVSKLERCEFYETEEGPNDTEEQIGR